MKKEGFILIIVLGLLGVLAFIVINFVGFTRQSKDLSLTYLNHSRAYLIAQSGLELAQTDILDLRVSLDISKPLVVGPGTYVTTGDTVVISWNDFNGKININDGILAGKVDPEFSTAYQANDLGPWGFETDFIPTPNPEALLNERIRRILNAYGDVHRFTDKVYGDDYKNSSLEDFYGATIPLPNPVYSTRTPANYDWTFPASHQAAPSADGPRGVMNAGPQNFTVSDPKLYSNGLGDRIIKNRPNNGYINLDEIEEMVNEWAKDPGIELSSEYLEGKDFYEIVKNDFTVFSYEDNEFFRLKNELGDYAYPELTSSSIPVLVDTLKAHGDLNSVQDLFGLGKLPADSSGTNYIDWAEHSVPLIDLNSASFFVRAAVFYAPTNVSYSCESTQTVPAYGTKPKPDNFGSNQFSQTTSHEAFIGNPYIGVSPPIFHPNKESLENGMSNEGRKSHLMSLRDAMHLANQYEDYRNFENKEILNFDDFRNFLIWHENNSTSQFPSFERAHPKGVYGTVKDHEDFNAGGLFHVSEYWYPQSNNDPPGYGEFAEDYISKTLPHILSCVRRIPSYYGAPSALQSPYMVTKPQLSIMYSTSALFGGVIDPSHQLFRKTEDFVWRFTHPKICFVPCGTYEINSFGSLKDKVNNVAKAEVTGVFKAFETKYFRTQKNFLSITDSVETHPDIRIGPESSDLMFEFLLEHNMSFNEVKNLYEMLKLIEVQWPEAESTFIESLISDEDLKELFKKLIALPSDQMNLLKNMAYPSEFLGVVGLRDFQDDIFLNDFTVSYDPQIVMNFNPIENNGLRNTSNASISPQPQDPGFAGTSAYPQVPQNIEADPWVKEINNHPLANPTTVFGFPSSEMEGSNYQIFTIKNLTNGNYSQIQSDLSPFNGLSFLGTNNNKAIIEAALPIPSLASFSSPNDSIYWRFDEWLKNVDTEPSGKNLSAGIMTFWFRLPGGYSYPNLLETSAVPLLGEAPISYSHVLAALNFWEALEGTETTNPTMYRPVAITVGLKKTPTRGLNVFARYDSGGHTHFSNDQMLPYISPPEFKTLSATKFDSSIVLNQTTPQYDYLGFLCLAASPAENDSYESYRAAGYRHSEVSIKFKSVPEAAPGSWHRVTAGWNLRWPGVGNLEPGNQLWIHLHNQSVQDGFKEYRESYTLGTYPDVSPSVEDPQIPLEIEGFTVYTGGDPEIDPQNAGGVGFMLPYNPAMSLTLGEAHSMRLSNSPLWGGKLFSYKKYVYEQLWRLNSTIDNFRFWMGPSSEVENLDHFNPNSPVYSSESTLSSMRYNVTRSQWHDMPSGFYEEPDWVINPKLPAGSRILNIGTRVYYPPDTNSNFPYVKLSAFDSEGEISSLNPSSLNEQDIFYPSYNTGNAGVNPFRIRLQYMAHKPKLNGDQKDIGGPIVYGGSDHFVNLPWIKELSIRYVPSGGSQLISAHSK